MSFTFFHIIAVLTLFSKLIIFGLFDGDPFGMEILSTLVNGSLSLRHENLAIPVENRHRVHWIGIRCADYNRCAAVVFYNLVLITNA